jgi:hypothetical protein
VREDVIKQYMLQKVSVPWGDCLIVETCRGCMNGFIQYTRLLMFVVVHLHAVAQLVEALSYKPEGRGFDSRWCHWNLSLI